MGRRQQNRLKTETKSIHRGHAIYFVMLGILMILCGLSLVMQGVSALSLASPDGSHDFSPASSTAYKLIVSNDPAALIPKTRVNLYFTNNSGTKSVTFTGGNLCADPLGSARNGSGNNLRDRPSPIGGSGFTGVPANGTIATTYYIIDPNFGSKTLIHYGRVYNRAAQADCYNHLDTSVFSGALLKFDAPTNLWYVQLEADINTSVLSNAQNRFALRVGGTGAFAIGYDSGLAANDFGLANDYPAIGPPVGGPADSNYSLKFGSQCNISADTTAFGSIFDLDYGNGAIQPNGPVSVQLLAYNNANQPVGGNNSVPLTLVTGSWIVKDSTNHVYVPTTGNNTLFKFSFKAQPGYHYKWLVNNVHYVNILQFQLPFDSIFNLTSCSPKGAVSTGAAVLTCDNLEGWAFDKDKTSKPLQITVYKDSNPSAAFVTKTANLATPTIPASYGVSGNHGFRVNLRTAFNITDGSLHTFYVYAQNVRADGTADTLIPKVLIGSSSGYVVDCASVPHCGSVSMIAADNSVEPSAETNEAFRLRVSNTFTAGTAPSGASYDITVPTLGFIQNALSAGPGGSAVLVATTTLTASSAIISQPVVNWTLYDSSGVIQNCTDTIDIVSKPYFKAYGGDLFAGGSFKDATGACPSIAATSGKLIGYYDNTNHSGAGSQLASIAVLAVSGVASAALYDITGQELTFANNAPYVSPLMGGNFGDKGAYCAPDYYKEELAKGYAASAATAVDISLLANNKQTLFTGFTGPLNIHESSAVNIQHTIFVDGDVFISNNITYDDSTPPSTITDIPYLSIIAKGNIYISQNVTRLDGLYIAQPDNSALPTNGYIKTCSDASSVFMGAVPCDTKLIVNGAFIAQKVVLQRTYGTLKQATYQEPNGTSSHAAEVFQMSPYLLIGSPVFKQLNGQYDTVKGLPPVL